MKLALDYFETSLKAGERELAEAREGQKAAQRNLDEQTERVTRIAQRNSEIAEAIRLLKAPKPAVEVPASVAPAAPAPKMNGKLSLPRQKPDALTSKLSQQ